MREKIGFGVRFFVDYAKTNGLLSIETMFLMQI